ncbi:killer toxin-resistance protein 5 [Monosporozyma servazzii]
MILYRMKVFLGCTFLFLITFVDAIKLTSVKNTTLDSNLEPVRIWSILSHIMPNGENKQILLNQLYPIITGLDNSSETYDEFTEEAEEEAENEHSTILNSVTQILDQVDKKNKKMDIDTPFNANLFQKFYDLYPFGFGTDRNHTTSKENYFLLNGKIFNRSDDSFYLKSEDLKKQAQLLDNEILSTEDNEFAIIGTNLKAPLIVFHGCPNHPEFDEFNRNLYVEATETEKIRFYWKPNCDINEVGEINQDFPITFTLKKNMDKKEESWKLLQEIVEIPKTFKNSLSFSEENNQNITNLDMKLTSLITRHYKKTHNFASTIKYFQDIVNNFPLLMNNLHNVKLNKREENKISKSNSILNQMGIDYHMLGLFVNGQNIKLSSLNHYSLINALTNEWRRMSQLKNYLLDYKLSEKVSINTHTKAVLNFFTNLAISNLQDLQPIRIDLHRIESFSDNVIYFNDIETDPQYDELSTNIQDFLAEKSKFGEIPEYRKNWNEIVFFINFDELVDLEESDAKDALEGIIRTFNVVKQGYPERIGLFPVGSEKSANILNHIYELKSKGDLNLVVDFLEDLSSGKIDILSLEASDDLIPDTSNLLESLDIQNATSISINGELYPFKSNAWYYLIAKVVKKDTATLKSEIKNEINSGVNPNKIDIRGLLHLKSAISKNDKFTPNYFSNSLYTSMNDAILSNLGERVINYTPNANLNILHTVSIYDDFNSLAGLKRLKNLQQIGFEGVRIRIIHSGDLTHSTWKTLKSIIEKSKGKVELNKSLNGLVLKTKDATRKSVSYDHINNILQNWLPDIPITYLQTSSFLVLNGRFIHFNDDEIPSTTQYESIIKREAKRVLDTVFTLENVFPGFSETDIDPDFIEMVSALLTKLFYHGSQFNNDGFEFTTETVLSRFSIDEYLKTNEFTIFENDEKRQGLVDVTFIIDPVEERTQKLLSFIPLLEDLHFVNIKVVLLPTEQLSFVPNERVYIESLSKEQINQDMLKSFDMELDVPDHFATSNISLFEGVNVEAHVYDSNVIVSEGNINGLGGLRFNILDENNNTVSSFTSMDTFGYGKFFINRFQKLFHVECLISGYEVESISSEIYSDSVNENTFTVSNLNPLRLVIKVKQDNSIKPAEKINSDVNIFSILTDINIEESKYKDNILQIVAADPGTSFTFWLLEDSFTSVTLKRFGQFVNDNPDINATIKFIRYDWPRWLRPQRYYFRKMDISRILYLDVLFPMNINKLVYMNLGTDKLLDPKEILQSEVKLACFSMFRMEGEGYWKHGYWEKRLKNQGLSFYNTEPAFVINLEEIRKRNIGDILRIHYQRLSADTQSLVNIGQDLLNDIQSEVSVTRLKRSLKRNVVLPNQRQAVEWEREFTKFEEAAQIIESQPARETLDHTESLFDIHDEL